MKILKILNEHIIALIGVVFFIIAIALVIRGLINIG